MATFQDLLMEDIPVMWRVFEEIDVIVLFFSGEILPLLLCN
jgi:hypothetical protein